ncbi:MAG: hypothetical protein ACI9QV_000622 [Methylophagaceae bacterium]|jgi:hypothetical protein
MSEETTEPSQQQLAREALFRHNDLTHPVIQVLINLKLEYTEDDE